MKIFQFLLSAAVFSLLIQISLPDAGNCEASGPADVPVYPNSSYDEELTLLSQQIQDNIRKTRPEMARGLIVRKTYFYISEDPMDKVVDFYQKSLKVDKVQSLQELFAGGNLPAEDKIIATTVDVPLQRQAEVYKTAMGLAANPEQYVGNFRTVTFRKGLRPEILIHDRFIHPKSFKVIEKTIIVILQE